jgi:predicted phosphate transport protein (TIGR00153 family)
MAKADRFYFQNFIEAADTSCKAATYLLECLQNYHPDRIQDMLDTMHTYEHDGDIKKHEMSAALAKAFVTPVDREDLAIISQNIDDVTNRIEEVLQRFYVDQVHVVTPDAIAFAQKIIDCCVLMKEMLAEFSNFKKPAKLHEMIISLNRMEEDCDRFYLQATLKIREHCDNILDIISWREIYDKFECCADACENVSNCIEMVVMKNT